MINLVLASPNQDRSVFWNQGLNGFASTTLNVHCMDILLDNIVRINPEILLLDFGLLMLNALDGMDKLNRLCTATKVIVMGDAISEDAEWGLLKVGVRGCCSDDSKPQFIKQVVEAVLRGELWTRRTLT